MTRRIALPTLTSADVVAIRPEKNSVDPRRPYAFLVEDELSAEGVVEPVATIFLTNRECPFRCVMCDLWKNTLDEPTPLGAIPEQIEFALGQLPPARIVKLYNSGNFFDAKAIPQQDWPRIAEQVSVFDRVIVENHPKMCGPECLAFRDLIPGQLEVAMGLETIHPEILPWLNKQMTLESFSDAAKFLISHDIDLRSFVLLRPPGLSETEGIEWAGKSVAFAVEQGVGCCAIVPTRGGNGAMEQLAVDGSYQPPGLKAMEQALEQSLQPGRARVMMDLWDAAAFADCAQCSAARIARIKTINETQAIPPAVECSCGDGALDAS